MCRRPLPALSGHHGKHSLPRQRKRFRATAGQFLRYNGAICDARFSKCCGGITERYATAWEDNDVPYLESIYDGPSQSGFNTPETWIRSAPPAYCNTEDSELLPRVLPGSIRRRATSIAGRSRTPQKNSPI